MKKRIQLAVMVLIALKVVAGFWMLNRIGIDSVELGRPAMASETDAARQTAKSASEIPSPSVELDLAVLLKKQRALEAKERDIAEQKAELLKLRNAMDAKLAALEKLRAEIRADLDKKRFANEQKLKHLIKVYSAMKPQNAANLIEKMDLQFAVQLFSQMKGEAVGGILSFVEVGKATRISEGLLKRQ